MMAFLYLVLSSLCSLAIAHLLKLTEVKQLRTLNTLTVNYLIAAVFALGVGAVEPIEVSLQSQETLLYVFCVLVGAFFITNFLVYGKSVHKNGVGVTITSMRLSLVIPVLISIYFYAEYLNGIKLIGLVGSLGSLVLLLPARKKVKIGNIDASWLLLIIFVLSGFADASLKIYKEEFSPALSELTFMGLVFLGAFIIGLIFCFYKGGPLITRKEALLGSLIGLPNLYSSIFLIYALDGISGSVAYPLVNILNVLGGTLLGLFIWGDTVTVKQWIGIISAIAAIILLV